MMTGISIGAQATRLWVTSDPLAPRGTSGERAGERGFQRMFLRSPTPSSFAQEAREQCTSLSTPPESRSKQGLTGLNRGKRRKRGETGRKNVVKTRSNSKQLGEIRGKHEKTKTGQFAIFFARAKTRE